MKFSYHVWIISSPATLLNIREHKSSKTRQTQQQINYLTHTTESVLYTHTHTDELFNIVNITHTHTLTPRASSACLWFLTSYTSLPLLLMGYKRSITCLFFCMCCEFVDHQVVCVLPGTVIPRVYSSFSRTGGENIIQDILRLKQLPLYEIVQLNTAYSQNV